MTINKYLPKTIVNELKVSTKLNDVIYMVAFENDTKPTPITKPIIVVSVKNCDIGPRITETLDTGESVETTKREVKTTLSTDIYLPCAANGNLGPTLFDRIATYLIFTKAHNIISAQCDEAYYDNDCESVIYKAHFV